MRLVMDKMGLLYAAAVCVAWGLSTFWDKLAVNSLGGGVAAKMAMYIWMPSLFIMLLMTIFHAKFGLSGEGISALSGGNRRGGPRAAGPRPEARGCTDGSARGAAGTPA